MTTLSSIVASLEADASAEWAKVKAEATVIEQEVEPVVESSFATLASQFGTLAVSTVMNLMGAAGAALSGGEKLNLTATTIVQAAEAAGVATVEGDVTALAKNWRCFTSHTKPQRLDYDI